MQTSICARVRFRKFRYHFSFITFVGMIVGTLPCSVAPCVAASSQFVRAGRLTDGRSGHTATLLADGRILIAGGSLLTREGDLVTLASAELYDPLTRTWTPTGSLAQPRHDHTATLLSNGMVLVAGGSDPSFNPLKSAELYDPGTGLWTATGDLLNARTVHTATRLQNGEVLVAGGSGAGGYLASAELYDPSTGAWSATGDLTMPRLANSMTLLTDGNALIVGGYVLSGGLPVVSNSAELYSPTTGTWTATGSMADARADHAATLLSDNSVLVAGGFNNGLYLASAEIYHPGSGTWSRTGHLGVARFSFTCTLLGAGQALAVGGRGEGDETVGNCELYDAHSRTWSNAGELHYSRADHTATLSQEGDIVIAGGFHREDSYRSDKYPKAAEDYVTRNR